MPVVTADRESKTALGGTPRATQTEISFAFLLALAFDFVRGRMCREPRMACFALVFLGTFALVEPIGADQQVDKRSPVGRDEGLRLSN